MIFTNIIFGIILWVITGKVIYYSRDAQKWDAYFSSQVIKEEWFVSMKRYMGYEAALKNAQNTWTVFFVLAWPLVLYYDKYYKNVSDEDGPKE